MHSQQCLELRTQIQSLAHIWFATTFGSLRALEPVAPHPQTGNPRNKIQQTLKKRTPNREAQEYNMNVIGIENPNRCIPSVFLPYSRGSRFLGGSPIHYSSSQEGLPLRPTSSRIWGISKLGSLFRSPYKQDLDVLRSVLGPSFLETSMWYMAPILWCMWCLRSLDCKAQSPRLLGGSKK